MGTPTREQPLARDSPAAPGAWPAPGTSPAACPPGPACNTPGTAQPGPHRAASGTPATATTPTPPPHPVPTHRCWTRIRSTRMCRDRTSAFRSSRASLSSGRGAAGTSVLHGGAGACPAPGRGAQAPAWGPPTLPRARLGGRWPGTRGRVAVGWLSLAVVTGTMLKPSASAKERVSAPGVGAGHGPATAAAPGAGTRLLPGSPALPCSVSAEAQGWGPASLGTAEVAKSGTAGPCSALPWGRRHSGDQAWTPARPRRWGHRGSPRCPGTATCIILLARQCGGRFGLGRDGGSRSHPLAGGELSRLHPHRCWQLWGEEAGPGLGLGSAQPAPHGTASAAMPQHRGHALGMGVLSPSRLPQPRTHPGAPPPRPSLSYRLLGSKKGLVRRWGKDPRYGPSPRDPSAGWDSPHPARTWFPGTTPSLTPTSLHPAPARGTGGSRLCVGDKGVLGMRHPQAGPVGDGPTVLLGPRFPPAQSPTPAGAGSDDAWQDLSSPVAGSAPPPLAPCA